MGFIDKESILFVDISEEADHFEELLENSRLVRKQIRSNAKKIVHRLHSPEARLAQLHKFINNYNGNFQSTARICNGDFKVFHS